MPHVSVKLYPGRSDEDKAELARAITKNVTTILKCGEESVSVAIEDVSPGNGSRRSSSPRSPAKPTNCSKSLATTRCAAGRSQAF